MMKCFSNVTESLIKELIKSAEKRLTYVAPGISNDIAEEFIKRWFMLRPEAVQIILDVDEEIFRLGYGSIDALQKLQKTAQAIGFNAHVGQQPGIRIGCVISDNRTLIFSPSPLLIESSEDDKPKTNGILLDYVPEGIAKELGIIEDVEASETKSVLDKDEFDEDKLYAQKIGLEKVPTKQIEQIAENFEKNPPVEFDITRIVRVFNSRIEFVEFELIGCDFKRKTIPLASSFFTKNDKIQRLLQARFKVFDEFSDDIRKEIERINEYKKILIKCNLVVLPKYGTAIRRGNKQSFLKEVRELEEMIADFKKNSKGSFLENLNKTVDNLVNEIFPNIKDNPPRELIKFIDQSSNSEEREERLKEVLTENLHNCIGEIGSIFKGMNVELRFKGVTYEMLQEEKFRNLVIKKFFFRSNFFEEFEAARKRN